MTVAFFDIDGVLNAIPYERVLGTSSVGDGWTRIQGDPDKYFVLDKQRRVNFVDECGRNRALQFNFSSELIEKVNSLIDEGLIEFTWLTTWREQSSTAARVLGLPEGLPWVNWSPLGLTDYYQYGKGVAIEELYLDGKESRRFIWIDDVATESRVNFPEPVEREEWFVDPDGEDDVFPKVEQLVIQTDSRFGISRAEWEAIEKFARQGN